MRYQENDQLGLDLLREMMEDMEDESRQHPSITDLIYCLTKTWYNAGIQKVHPNEKTMLMFAIGLGLETALLSHRRSTPATGEYGGIYYHIDSLDGGEGRLIEFKTTRASAKQEPPDFPDSWLKQIKGYLRTQWTDGSKPCSASVGVLYIIPSILRCWDIDFEEWEIEENWQYLLERKVIWDQATIDGDAPMEYRWNQDWECKDCSYSMVCEAKQAVRRRGQL